MYGDVWLGFEANDHDLSRAGQLNYMIVNLHSSTEMMKGKAHELCKSSSPHQGPTQNIKTKCKDATNKEKRMTIETKPNAMPCCANAEMKKKKEKKRQMRNHTCRCRDDHDHGLDHDTISPNLNRN